MIPRRLREEKGFLSLIAMLVTLAIICYLVFTYFRASTKSLTSENGTGYQNLVGQARSQVKKMNERTGQTDKEIDELTKQAVDQFNK